MASIPYTVRIRVNDLQRNTTHFVKIIIPRIPNDGVFTPDKVWLMSGK